MKKNIVNVVMVIIIIATSIWNIEYFVNRSFKFSNFENLNIEFSKFYSYEHKGEFEWLGINGETYEELQEELSERDLEFDPANINNQQLKVLISGGNFRDATVTQTPYKDGKFIYYVQPYDSISGRTVFTSRAITNFEDYRKEYTSVDEYIAGVYIATPEKDYLIYGEDVATEKFDVQYPMFTMELGILIGVILACVCIYNRAFNQNLSDKQRAKNDISSIVLSIFLVWSCFISTFNSDSMSTYYNVMNTYNIINITSMCFIIVGTSIALYNASKRIKTVGNKNFTISMVAMCTLVCITIVFDKLRMLEQIGWKINPDYFVVFFGPLQVLVLVLMFIAGFMVYKNDSTKTKQPISKAYKVMQGILILNILFFQNVVLYIYNQKSSLLDNATLFDGKPLFFDLIMLSDIVNLSACVMLVYAFYLLVKRKDYMMLMIILQCMASSMEKTNYFSLHLGSLDNMQYLTCYVFILSYLMIGASIVFVSKLRKGVN